MYISFKGKDSCLRSLMLCSLIVTALSGCATTAGIEAAGKTDWNQDGERILGKHVVINNSSLAGDIQIVDMKSSLAGDLMKAQVSLRSKDRDTISIQYSFNWFDIQGMAIGGGTAAWKPFTLYGRETTTIQGVGPDPRAREFKLNIRDNND